MSKDYSTVCKINEKPNIKALMDYSKNLAGLEFYVSKLWKEVPENLKQSQNFADSNLNQNLVQMTNNFLFSVLFSLFSLDDLRSHLCLSQLGTKIVAGDRV